jgi:hypothetical protein
MSSEERARILAAKQLVDGMPLARRKALLTNWKRWRALPEARRAAIVSTWQRLATMPARDRARFIGDLRRWKELSPIERRRLRRVWGETVGRERRR